MKYGYARASTGGQSADALVRQLTKAGCKNVFREMASRAKTDGAQLRRLRTPTTPEAERKGAFARLAPYRDGAIFTAKFAGRSAWERHPKGDEIVQIVDGATTLHLMTAEGRQCLSLSSGMMAIVPQGIWHQFDAPDGVCVMTATPQPTEHLRVVVEDPTTIAREASSGAPPPSRAARNIRPAPNPLPKGEGERFVIGTTYPAAWVS